ncbi:hypothetical protein LOAG_06526 [Loa loa]|uniref:Uncharacterized protein n=1 Tax=Loa loa TaxID=7209 RepID=A0A1S0TXX0_LOALO|nr:hypothetical protein LOAG_06526 [Loa loa]EFO21959.1 hypothetical protein LOAG_06526 [Loa loa]
MGRVILLAYREPAGVWGSGGISSWVCCRLCGGIRGNLVDVVRLVGRKIFGEKFEHAIIQFLLHGTSSVEEEYLACPNEIASCASE